uniref:DDE superfamily endonuclease n=1 Tax=Candidatus Kentrum eta TaxID=2126337 RepID=A0A450VHT0_9GAMM|nr:MAG: DDE superfamily endonuclease [Candidatus Kentron sp. H]VFJ98754.1 MAG: DDE superfamily endonuclease [Candidatus Kentron sp. H]VFK04308.1 MAG: DDE superfamily endonuclease [Candidatus Kentron sp. H]
MDEFPAFFPHVKNSFMDGTQRPVQRPKDGRNRKRYYSGKKKAYTRKNLVGADENKTVLLLSPTKNGPVHDKKRMESIPPHVMCRFDEGFQGLEDPNVIGPKKKPKGTALTDEEKEQNRIISGIRMVNEHAMAGIDYNTAVTILLACPKPALFVATSRYSRLLPRS